MFFLFLFLFIVCVWVFFFFCTIVETYSICYSGPCKHSFFFYKIWQPSFIVICKRKKKGSKVFWRNTEIYIIVCFRRFPSESKKSAVKRTNDKREKHGMWCASRNNGMWCLISKFRISWWWWWWMMMMIRKTSHSGVSLSYTHTHFFSQENNIFVWTVDRWGRGREEKLYTYNSF